MTETSATGLQLHQPGDKPSLFQKGHPRYGGRKKGGGNRFGGDLREAVVAGIQAAARRGAAEDAMPHPKLASASR